MTFLDELDKCVRLLIEQNKTLEYKLTEVTLSFEALEKNCKDLERALFEETTTVGKLLDEKESIKLEIDELLGSIKALSSINL